MRGLVAWWRWLALALALGGCLDDGRGLTGNHSCAQLGWSCGVDDYAISCGTCGPAQACSGGVCVGPGPVVHTIASGATAVALPGAYSGTLFSVPAMSQATWSASSSGLFQLGIFTISDWNIFVSGQASGALVLEGPTPSTSGSILVGAGTYVLGFRCLNTIDPCTITYWLNATY